VKIASWIWSILAGWVTLLVLAYIVEGPVLRWIGPWVGFSWSATVHLTFDCAVLTAAGFAAGRFHRSHPMKAALAFAITLCFWDFGTILALNVPWLVHLVWNSFHDSRYLDSLATSVETHLLLFGCLFGGAKLSQRRETPLSIAK